MKLLVLISIITFFTTLNKSQAELPGLYSTYSRQLSQVRHQIISSGSLSNGAPKTCPGSLLKTGADGQINITVAFGYMDVSPGQQFENSANHLYGPGDVLDRDARLAMENILMTRCNGRKNFACGFKRKGNRLIKKIKNRFAGQAKKITVNINLVSPAVTTSDAENQQIIEQEQSSSRVRRAFLNSFGRSDAVLYLGHARSGGGPDFYPPILGSGGRVNYSHYKAKQEGIRSMLSALSSAPAPTPIIGVLACKSTGLFARRIRKAAPSSVLVTADDLYDYNDILPTGYAMLEAIIGQRCKDSFVKTTKVRPASQKFLKIFF